MKISKLRKKLKKMEKKHGNIEVTIISWPTCEKIEVRNAYVNAPSTSIYSNTPAHVVISS